MPATEETNDPVEAPLPNDPRTIGAGWRIFQVVALLTAMSYIVGWLMADPSRYFARSGGGQEAYTGLISFLSPLVSILLIALALIPERLRWLTHGRSAPASITRVLLLALTVAWMVNAFFTPMYMKLVTTPTAPSMVLPVPGGVFLHMVFQHWFQSAATIVMALYPRGYKVLTHSSRPAGLQCAIVRCPEPRAV